MVIKEAVDLTIKYPGQDMRNLRVSLYKCTNWVPMLRYFPMRLK